MVATKPVDFRKGMEGLATLVRESMGRAPGLSTSGSPDVPAKLPPQISNLNNLALLQKNSQKHSAT
ncbi:hypothetical protein [Bradyrhizobium sp. STM 3566]|uniref:hypothetical protein n=1 Tax=Bradyrhizobium sp. STM 3566 TaxID=578928 RepID=UPI00388E5094